VAECSYSSATRGVLRLIGIRRTPCCDGSCEAVPDVNMHCGLREIDSMKLDAGHRFREWRYDEALITGIVLAICFPLMMLAVAISGREQGADQRDVQLGRQLWPKRVAHPVAQYRDHI
jgi:hypothetical protein